MGIDKSDAMQQQTDKDRQTDRYKGTDLQYDIAWYRMF